MLHQASGSDPLSVMIGLKMKSVILSIVAMAAAQGCPTTTSHAWEQSPIGYGPPVSRIHQKATNAACLRACVRAFVRLLHCIADAAAAAAAIAALAALAAREGERLNH